MNPELAVELHFFAFCILWGGLVLLAYDFLRVIRRLIKHGNLLLALEDLIFWFIAGILIFAMIYRQNNGIIRGFAVMGMTAGMLLYNMLVGERLVNVIVKLIRILIKPIAALLRFIRIRLDLLEKRIKNILKLLLKQLNLACKSIKMRISRIYQKSLQKRQEKLKKRRRLSAERKAAKKRYKKRAAKTDGSASAGKEPDKAADAGIGQLRIHKREAAFSRISEEELKQILRK
ncbi:MAG: hypothetical protein GX757_11935 [Clostridiales bacterium]|nr:hypothetical protein [Clostridiales bacterium]